jgi:hypothetical protein
MTRESSHAPAEISHVSADQDLRTPSNEAEAQPDAGRKKARARSQPGGGAAAEGAAPNGEWLPRARRRRLDLRSLDGTLRESARIYREAAEGRISLASAEVRSRILRRHGELLAAREQQQQLADIQAQLKALGAPGATGALTFEPQS